MPVTLEQILTSTRGRIPALRDSRATLEREAAAAPLPAPLTSVLRREAVAVIAEVKRRSPSAGTIRDDLDPASRAELYGRAGASAISVLTDGPFFGGSLDDLRAAALRVQVPVLRKDFILDELQIVEARAAGASAVLLIVRALSPRRLAELVACAGEWRLDALVEVHSAAELGMALDSGAEVVGVNSRDLETFRIDTAKAWDVLRAVPPAIIAVAESGMATAGDVEAAAVAGADAVLIGTALSFSSEPDRLLADLIGTRRRGR